MRAHKARPCARTCGRLTKRCERRPRRALESSSADRMSCVDIHVAPFALRLPQLERQRGFRRASALADRKKGSVRLLRAAVRSSWQVGPVTGLTGYGPKVRLRRSGSIYFRPVFVPSSGCCPVVNGSRSAVLMLCNSGQKWLPPNL